MIENMLSPFFAFLLGCAAVFCCNNPVVGDSQFTSEDFLSSSGTHVVNRRGEIVLQRGFNIGGWLIKSIYMSPISGAADDTDVGNILETRFGQAEADRLQQIYLDNFMTVQSDFDTIAKTGANSVRLPFWWRNFMDENGDFILNDQGKPDFSMLDRAVAQCAARGIYVTYSHSTAHRVRSMAGNWSGFGYRESDLLRPQRRGRSATAPLRLNCGRQNCRTLCRRSGGRRIRHPRRTILDRYDQDPITAGGFGTFTTMPIKAIRAVDPNHLLIFESSWDVKDLPLPSATSRHGRIPHGKTSPTRSITIPGQWEKCDKAKMLAGFKKRFNKDRTGATGSTKCRSMLEKPTIYDRIRCLERGA